jgi:acyl-CoA thioester hydrolase
MDTHLQYPISISIPIQWGDMDAFDHVNNVVYLKFFESARIAYFEKMGIVGNTSSHIGPILASTQCKFIFPLRYPDQIWATARATDVQTDRFVMEYAIYSQNHQRIAAKGSGIIVSFDYEKQGKVELPPSWKEKILFIEDN